MPYTIETFYPEAGLYLPTNHTSDDLHQLKEIASSKIFAGFKIRIVDNNGNVVFEPPVVERTNIPDASDMADMFNAPILDPEDLDNLSDPPL